MIDLNQLDHNIHQWAEDRDLINPDNTTSQALKVSEEVGELARGVLKNDERLIVDSLGDVYVTLSILAQQCGYNLADCVQHAWDEIKDRKGETINGTFIKEEHGL